MVKMETTWLVVFLLFCAALVKLFLMKCVRKTTRTNILERTLRESSFVESSLELDLRSNGVARLAI